MHFKDCLIHGTLALTFLLAACKTSTDRPIIPGQPAAVQSPAMPPSAPAAPEAPVPPTETPIPFEPARVPRTEPRLPGIFSHNMVLQQGASVPLWGWADDGDTVTVTFRDQRVSTVAKNGRWLVKLKPLKAGGPDTLTISNGKPLQLTNVLVGEVWVCSGQSNMDWPMKKAFQPDADIAAATNSQIRLFKVPKVKADVPQDNVEASWEVSSPDLVKDFSAVAYYFGRDLQAARTVPVGLIQTSWGGSPAEVWMSRDVLENNPRYKAEILGAYPEAHENFKRALAGFEEQKALALKQKKEFKQLPPRPVWKPSELYNGMIAPLIPYAIKGAIWYQGESNAGRAEQYRTLFADMIRNWRRDWKQGDFPFLTTQLAPFKPIKPQPEDSDWAELREAQLLSTKVLPNAGIAVITDVGEEHDIHPTKKAPVGARLALAARGIAYGERLVYSGPVFKTMKVKDGKAILSFDHVGSGLEARGGALKGFSIGGPAGKFLWALGEIQPDNTVTVWSPNVPQPTAVRFGWADYPVVNLWNREGLPASPFRTDNFPMITAGKK